MASNLELCMNRPTLEVLDNMRESPFLDNNQKLVVSYQVGGRSLRKTEQRDKHFAAERKVNSSKKRWQVKRPQLTQRRQRQKSRIIGAKPLNSERLKNRVNVWSGEGKLRQSGRHLPAPEDEFLKDMLSDQPRFQSNSQAKPMEYWEKAAATLPEYLGPWQPPVVETMPQRDFEFYS
ncbi:hypothetical protein AALO_G00012880 [Alosa alosa]|uniref:Uncharacterized protein n=1 Tax=Alosa alosa TaxID=278164 RepID=A0AAV6HJZ8_9TELE|nr:hypothetical protein AALO_G00012880 [Alosa alosa]